MFTAATGAYRTTKIVIDWINIILGVVVIIMTTLIFALKGSCDFLIPIVIFCGAGINGLHATKNFLRYEKKIGMGLSLICILLLVLTYVTAKVMW